ncbi:MAG: preprotein translocase subunit YajC [Terriglobales bacterium]
MNVQHILAIQAGNPLSQFGFAVPIVLMFAVFYFFLIRPQQQKQKKWQQMLSELKNGDKVVTSGGMRGTIISLKDDYVQLRVPPDNLRIEVSRASVVSVANADDAVSNK